MLAARDRAGGTAARAALLRRDVGQAGQAPAGQAPAPETLKPAPTEPAATASAPTPAALPAPARPVEGDTLARLREAKKRARGR
jgi:hypothetical protein